MSHFISIPRAKEMIALYRTERENILKPEFQGQDIIVYSETFTRAEFDIILAKPGCEKLRIYYGMSEDLKIHAIIVGVDAEGRDVLMESSSPVTSTTATTTVAPTISTGPGDNIDSGDGDEENEVIEEGARCPPLCPEP